MWFCATSNSLNHCQGSGARAGPQELAGAMGRARDAQIRLGWFLIFAFGIWLWPQLDTTPQADPQARNVEGLGPRTAGRLPTEVHDLAGRDRVVDSPKIKRDASTKWWGEWADGRERAIPTDRFDKPSGELASVVCMTALPERLLPADGHPKSLTELTVQDLWRQPDLLILTVPASDAHTIPAWVTQYEENVVVVRTRIDYGPSTRAVGCMFAIPEEYGDRVAIIEVDDDAAYPPNFVAGFLTYLKRHPTGAFSLSGFTANGDMAGEVRQYISLSNDFVIQLQTHFDICAGWSPGPPFGMPTPFIPRRASLHRRGRDP